MITLTLNGSSKGTLDVFTDFVPLEYEHYMTDENALLIGVVESGPSGLVACGITIMTVEDGRLIVKWIWVDPDMHNMGYGSKMLDTCFKTAEESGVSELSVFVPIQSDAEGEDHVEEYFYSFGFSPVGTRVSEGISVHVLTADVDTYFNMDNDLENMLYAQSKLKKGYDKFPTDFMVTGIVYFSEVPVVI